MFWLQSGRTLRQPRLLLGNALPASDRSASRGLELQVVEKIEIAGLLLGVVGTLCWVICFWWMHRISERQNTTLKELHDVASRIEALSKEGHELISEVHPAVAKIKESIQDVAIAVDAEDSAGQRHAH